MNISTRSRIAAIATLGVLASLAACGNDTVSDPDPGTQSVANKKVNKSDRSGSSATTADAAERRAAADKARQDQASTDRWARGTNVENKLKYAGHPGRP